jgi:hypothetical protein
MAIGRRAVIDDLFAAFEERAEHGDFSATGL